MALSALAAAPRACRRLVSDGAASPSSESSESRIAELGRHVFLGYFQERPRA